MAAPWSLTLFVSGAAPRSTLAISTVRGVCDERRSGGVALTVVDAAAHPGQAVENDVVALPTLVKLAPGPVRHLVGNLTDPQHIRSWFDQVLGPRSGSTDPGQVAP